MLVNFITIEFIKLYAYILLVLVLFRYKNNGNGIVEETRVL